MQQPRIYLAGTDGVWSDWRSLAKIKKDICRKYGLEGVFPLDGELDLSGLSHAEQGLRISLANEEHMRSCDAIVANMTPFRGPGMDGGTAFEMGFMRALGRPVLGYTNVASPYLVSVRAAYGEGLRLLADGSLEDPAGNAVEDFALPENLMMAGAVLSSKAEVVCVSVPEEELFTNVRGFERAVVMLSNRLR